MRSFVLAALCLLPFSSIAQQGVDPALKSHVATVYPPLARQLRIQGVVRIAFGLDRDGMPVAINLISGHPLLAPAALEAVKAWRFQMPTIHLEADRRYDATIEFRFSGERTVRNPVGSGSDVPPFLREEVVTSLPELAEIQVSDCPHEPDTIPPASVANDDFVELSRSECYGTCPAYTLKVKSDGEILWEGRSYVSVKGKRRASVKAEQARALLDKFRTNEFWQLCGSYSRPITDNPTTLLSVSLGGRRKVVSNYANAAPPWVKDLEVSVDSIAPIHLWEDGDPKTEPLSRLGRDRYFFKPGVTPLMRAAIRNDADQMRSLLASGSSVSDADASGWAY